MTYQEEINQGGHVAYIHSLVPIAIGIAKDDIRSIAFQQIVNQSCHITDVDRSVAIHVTHHFSIDCHNTRCAQVAAICSHCRNRSRSRINRRH